ncbi:glutaminyl-tRNA synthetase [Jaminaea rosea]|uniref:glutamine--tRNA ligase n=1 Tax=Jaminaea rosea TaxID=1569628 RepID=A0A316UJQ1_9BASI|nr:glutaminyl-tRNA synthetase [Jaminaea rosea]PWN25449.1 glutaminyl-tRNA synthetase [Jaminaea rosea]
MPPKLDANDPAIKEVCDLFATISFTGAKAQETARKPAQAALISDAIRSHKLGEAGLDAKQGQLVVSAIVGGEALGEGRRSYLVERTKSGELDSDDRVKTAIKYLASLDPAAPIDDEAFNAACGVGVVVTPDQVKEEARKYVSENKADLDAKNGGARPNLSSMLAALKSIPALRWANTLDIKNAGEEQLNALWPKQAEAAQPKKAKKAAASTPAPAAAAGGSTSQPVPTPASSSAEDPTTMFTEGFLSKLHLPGENPQLSSSLKEQHLSATRGRVFTRFPPEPNGYLHIGHTKAIAIDFGYAAHHGGLCYLRFDDTNPEAEEGKYFQSILETVRWLGFEPWTITYSSDYFQQLYELAIKLIERGGAYVDHSTAEEIQEERGGKERGGERKESKWRNRPIEENLREFEAMRAGKYAKGTATLRLKQDILGNPNPQMWDLIAYRVLSTPHHRTGSTWCIYPTYDFTHCLVDSIENISHSLCTTEFVLSRESYEWLCDAVAVYKPRQYEFGRLNLEGTITSKRKIRKLVEGGYVKDWDDPRLFTVIAIRRRGVPPGAILSFVSALGVSTAVSQITAVRFDQSIRSYLESSTPRLMMVLQPLRVILENVPEGWVIHIEKPLHPKVPEWGKNVLPLTREVFIEQSDFRTQDDPDYFRLAPGKSVGLFQAPFPITCLSHEVDPTTGQTVLIRARYEDPEMGGQSMPRSALKKLAYIHWVSTHAPSRSPVKIDEARIFHPLFTVENPAASPDFLGCINPDSLEVHSGALIEPGFWGVAKEALKTAHREAGQRTEKAKAERVRLTKEGGDVIRPPAGCSPLTSSGEGAPNADEAEGLVGLECVRFQAMRVGYFAVDRESLGRMSVETGEEREGDDAEGALVLNRIVSLKATPVVAAEKGKAEAKGTKK